MTSKLDRCKAIDDAYNARDWDGYSAFLDESFCAGCRPKQNLTGRPIMCGPRVLCDFCRHRGHSESYIVAICDGEWTCTIARFTGSMIGPAKRAEGKAPKSTNRAFDTTFATIARWVHGKVVEEYEFLDVPGLMRQIEASK